jgi:hypothetical protein
MPLTEEEKQRRREALARGREKAAANRAALKPAAFKEALLGTQMNVMPSPEPKPVAMPPIVHEGETPPATIGEPWREGDSLEAPAEEPQDDFERFLAAQDADIRDLLSDVELRVIYEAEQKRAAEEKKTAAKKLAVQRAQRHARSTAGLIGPEAVAAANLRERMNMPVSWVVNMPEAGNSGTLIDEGIRINGKLYVHGTTVEGTLAEYISYREIEYRAHENERQFQGRSRMSKLAQSGMRFLNNEGHA